MQVGASSPPALQPAGPPRRRSARNAPAALALALGVAGCAEAEAPPLLRQLLAPATWRVGTPLEVRGRGLAGRQLAVGGAKARVALQWRGQDSDGLESAWGHLPADPAWREGQVIDRVCLDGADLGPYAACLGMQARFADAWKPQVPSLQAPAPWRWGQRLAVDGAALLLPGEGAQWLEIDSGGQVRQAELVTRAADGRSRGEVVVRPAWLGAQPGTRQWRLRLVGAALRADGTTQAETTPWSAWQSAAVATPELRAAGAPPGWRRGDWAPVAATAVADDGSWQLQWSGQWRWRAQAAPAQFATPGGVGGHSPATSAWWQQNLAWPVAPLRFDGEVRLVVDAGGDSWSSPPLALSAPLLPALQRVDVEAGPAWRAALARLGLLAHAAAVEQALLARLQQLFDGYAVHIALVGAARDDGRERLHLRLGDRDGNGLGLLGAEVGTAKDVGNQVLDEQLAGFDPQAWQAGQAAVAGVFVGEVLGFSARLYPDRPSASPAFDQVFAPWCPALGGTPARTDQAGAAHSAIRQLAWVVAEVAAHEIGHALGLAAGGAEPHHPTDHPGWIMDSGAARPWAERAGLPGAAPSQWGPVDAAYLQAILPGPAR